MCGKHEGRVGKGPRSRCGAVCLGDSHLCSTSCRCEGQWALQPLPQGCPPTLAALCVPGQSQWWTQPLSHCDLCCVSALGGQRSLEPGPHGQACLLPFPPPTPQPGPWLGGHTCPTWLNPRMWLTCPGAQTSSGNDPDWASYTLGVFICLSCSGIHRNIPQVSKVKSIRLDAWDEAQVEFMACHGNDASRAKFESKVPSFYYRPTLSDCQLLREQWIRAKYERQEFIYPEKQEPYSAGYREGFLWKRGRDNGQFLSRKFVLTEREGALKYFNRNDAKEPKAVMKIEHLNATFQPAKIGHPHGLQVTYLKDNSTRNIFIYHEDGKLVPKLSRNYLKEGYMEKTGPKQTEGFRKRWFTMDDRRLMYFKDPLDAFARGEVFIGSKESGYTVLRGLPPSTQGHHWPHGITIVTPDRKFLFACETESDQREWVAAFQKAVDRPMLPQEYAGEQDGLGGGSRGLPGLPAPCGCDNAGPCSIAVEAHFKHKP
uniref:ArfGAP with dual PH domains 1 n=1 Tax=Callithrix jacchus TaxID=9483 RepID=A0A8I4A2N8_CALJA